VRKPFSGTGKRGGRKAKMCGRGIGALNNFKVVSIVCGSTRETNLTISVQLNSLCTHQLGLTPHRYHKVGCIK